MVRQLFFFPVILFTICVSSQSAFLDQLKIYQLNDPVLKEIQFSVYKKDIDKKKPLLLFLGGSGLEPTFKYNRADQQVYYTGFYRFSQYKDRYHIVFINKAGIPLYDSVNNNNEQYKVTPFAEANNTADWRAQSASKAIDYLLKVLPVDTSQVIVVGHSQETPLENMLRLNIPILLIAGGRDVEGAYIANTDYAALEFIRKGKQNLTYKVYPNYDHIYGETTRKYGEEIGLGFKANAVVDDIFIWLGE